MKQNQLISMTDEERIQTIDLINGTSPEEDVIWALNYLLNLPDEDDLPLFAQVNIMIIFKVLFWLLMLPFKLLFWWVPKGDDSYDKDDEEYMFWKEHGHDW